QINQGGTAVLRDNPSTGLGTDLRRGVNKRELTQVSRRNEAAPCWIPNRSPHIEGGHRKGLPTDASLQAGIGPVTTWPGLVTSNGPKQGRRNECSANTRSIRRQYEAGMKATRTRRPRTERRRRMVRSAPSSRGAAAPFACM